MHKIDKILIGTHNEGKFKEISDLLPLNVKKLSPKDLDMTKINYWSKKSEPSSYY